MINIINHTLNMDLANKINMNSPINIKQNDANSHKFIINIFNSSLSHNLSDTTSRIYFKKPDGTKVFLSCVLDGSINNKLSVLLTTQALTAIGSVACEITIYGTSGEIQTSFTFNFNVLENIRDDEVIESTNDFSALTDALAVVTTITNKLAQAVQQSNTNASQILGLASGSPKGIYAAITNITTAFPSGNTNIYLTSGNGKWNYWNGSEWASGGIYMGTDANKLPLTWSTGRYLDNGVLDNNVSWSYTNTIILNKGTKIFIHAVSGSPTTPILSEWSPIGVWLGYIVGSMNTQGFSYTVLKEVEYLKITNLSTIIPNESAYIEIVSALNEIITPIYDKVNLLNFGTNKEITWIPTSYIRTDGTINYNGEIFYNISNTFTLNKGNTIFLKVWGSINVLSLSKWTSGDIFIEGLLTGDGTIQEFLYTATDDIEYLKITNNVENSPLGVFVCTDANKTILGNNNKIKYLENIVMGLI